MSERALPSPPTLRPPAPPQVNAFRSALGHVAWAVLRDCHLGSAYSLEWVGRLYTPTSGDDVAVAYRPAVRGGRLWLTCAPSATLPSSLVGRAFKLAIEPARGVHVSRQCEIIKLEGKQCGFCAFHF